MSRHFSDISFTDLFALLHMLPPGGISYPNLAEELNDIRIRVADRSEYALQKSLSARTVMRWCLGEVASSRQNDRLALAVRQLLLSWAADPARFPTALHFVQKVKSLLRDTADIDTAPLGDDPAGLIHQLISAVVDKDAPTQPQAAPPPLPVTPIPTPTSPAPAEILTEGMCLTAVHPQFMARLPHTDEPLSAYYSDLLVGGQRIRIPYKELFGSRRKGVQEYVEGRNLFMLYEDWTADFGSCITTQDFSAMLETERRQAAALGYTEHPPKLCLLRQLEQKDRGRQSLGGCSV